MNIPTPAPHILVGIEDTWL